VNAPRAPTSPVYARERSARTGNLIGPNPHELRYVTSVTGDRENAEVALAQGATGADVLGASLRQALAQYPHVFGGLTLPSESAQLKARMAELLPQFEAARIASEEAGEIARTVCLGATAHLRYEARDAAREPAADALADPGSSLADELATAAAPLPLVRVDLPGPGRLRPSAEYQRFMYRGDELAQLASALDEAHFATKAATRALAQLGERASTSHELSLAGQRFVLFGAGAELSPVYTLLEAGAEVLWLDRARPPIDHLLEPRLSGALLYVDAEVGGVDLLRQPAAVRATILEFADGRPVHFGMHAFASGQCSPLLISLTMNEIVRSLPPGIVQSLSYLLAPTSVSFVAPEDAAVADERRGAAPTLRRALARTGSLQAGHLTVREQRLSCAVVQQQGASFQVAEYIGKRLAAEAFSSYGSGLDGDPRRNHDPSGPRLPVYANMAPITRTRSLASPLMEASLLGSSSYDLLIAQASTARSVCSLLTVHDLLAARPTDVAAGIDAHAARLAKMFALQFHGGVQAQPYALEGIVRLATLRGIAQRPKLAFEFWR
jgi:hypothetical protein